MKKANLPKLIGKILDAEYPSKSYSGVLTCDIIHGRPYYHLIFKSQAMKSGKMEECITTVFLEEKNLKYSEEDGRLISKIDFYPEWNHFKDEKEEYKKLEKELNKFYK